MNRLLYKALARIVQADLLNWADEDDGDDLQDAIDHSNTLQNRNMEKGFDDFELIEIKKVHPKTLLPSVAFKGKPFGWLKEIPKSSWVFEFKKAYERDISTLLKLDEIYPPIVISGDLCDGYMRVKLAYSLGEEIPVAFYKGVYDDNET